MEEQEWEHISEIADDTLDYIDKRRKGQIKSLKSGYPKLDASGIDGIEWGSIVGIAARMGVGKTAFSSCLLRGFLNPELNEQDFEILDMNWEMAARVLLLRELSAGMQQSYKYIISADGNILSDEEFGLIRREIKERYKHLPIHYVQKPKSPKEFANVVRKYRDRADRKGKKLLVRVDHASLAKVQDGDQVRTLYNLLGEANEIKREDNMTTFIFLNQLKSIFDEKQENATNKAFPTAGLIFGAEALGQYAETILILNKPSKYGITYYGSRPNGIEVQPYHLFCHVVKNRNAPPDLIIPFGERFSEMTLLDLSTGHITEDTNTMLTLLASQKDTQLLPFRYAVHSYGYIIFIDEESLGAEEWTIMQELRPIIQYALQEDCMLINFDRDAAVSDEFPIFNW